ncbi:MAG: acyl carrier protein [bacterium]
MTTIQRLQRIIGHGELRRTTDLYSLGLDSLALIGLMYDIESEFSISLPRDRLMHHADLTVQDLVTAIEEETG